MNILLISEEGKSREALTTMFSERGFSLAQTLDEATDLGRVDLVVIGAGRATTFGSRFGGGVLNKLTRYVFEGGRYLGICAGAYLALQPYNSETTGFNLSPREALDIGNWDRGCGDVKINWEGRPCVVHYENGPIFGAEPDGCEEVAAVYVDGFDEVMKDGIAAVKGQAGRGRYFLFGFHPELKENTRFMVEEAIDFLFREE